MEPCGELYGEPFVKVDVFFLIRGKPYTLHHARQLHFVARCTEDVQATNFRELLERSLEETEFKGPGKLFLVDS